MKTVIAHLCTPIVIAFGLLVITTGCERKSDRLVPFGWKATGMPSDSLLVRLDRGLQSYIDPDSLESLVEQYDRMSKEEDPTGVYAHRRTYWKGTSLFMHGDFERGDSLRRLAMQMCDSSRFPHDYRLYRMAIEQPTDFTDNLSRYNRYVSDLKSFLDEGDLVSAFSRCVMLSQQMSEAGMHNKALEYVLMADSLLERADLPLLRFNNKVNVASCRFYAGDTIGAVKTLDEMKADSIYCGDETVNAIIDFNKYEMTGDMAALASAWKISSSNPALTRMNILVGASMVNSGMGIGTADEKKRMLELIGSADEYAYLPEEDLEIKKAVCRLLSEYGDVVQLQNASVEYQEAVDKYLREQKKGDVIAGETAAMINEVSLNAEKDKQRSRNIMWIAIIAVGAVIAAAVVFVLVYVNRHRRVLLLTQLEIERHRRREMASDLSQVEKCGGEATADRDVSSGSGAASEAPSHDENDDADYRDAMFMKAFMERYPKVGKTGRRLALFIRAGKDTGDIARILNIRKESVMQARWRLRRQMDLAPEEDLEIIIHKLTN